MQDNVQITAHRCFTYHSNTYKNVLEFYWKNTSFKNRLFVIPKPDGTYTTLGGQGHIRGTFRQGLRDDFGSEEFNDYEEIFAFYSAMADTIQSEHGTVR